MSATTYCLVSNVTTGNRNAAPQLRYITAAVSGAERSNAVHTHTCTEFFFVTGGHGSFQVADRVFPTAVNDVIIVNANMPHTEESRPDNPLSYVVLGVERLEVAADIGGSTMIHLRGQSQIDTCLDMMLREAQNGEEGWERVCQSLLEIILQKLTRRKDFSIADAPTSVSSKANQECELVRRYIDNHFKENLRLDELADLAHINKYYLSHAFQKKFGTSPISYLISRRIQESRYLLTDTDHTLSQIARILGFSSLSYFSQSFRRLEGISPIEYRKRYRDGDERQGDGG